MPDMEDNIATRLKLFMEHMNVSNSQFADTCGIPRPSLSQILTGRNKKISDILIGQIHAAFPQFSIMWLLFGEGNMIVSEEASTSSEGENSDDTEIFADDCSERSIHALHSGVNGAPIQDKAANTLNVDPSFRTRGNFVKIDADQQPLRKISHITVYYDDSTFETFYPKK